jgi:hypothetical protein
MLSNDQAISMFNTNILPAIMREEQQRTNPRPDWPARQQAWNNFVDSLSKSGEIPESVGYNLQWHQPKTITKMVMGLPWFQNQDDAARYYARQHQSLWDAEKDGRINIGTAPPQLGEYYRTMDRDGRTVVWIDVALGGENA